MFISAIYVSRRTSNRVVPQAEMDELTAMWNARNARMGVRGVLLVANRHIAQIYEGPEEAVDELVANASRDPRMTGLTVIERRPIDGYRFTDWCFAYWGTASYMDQKIATVLEKQDGLSHADDTAELFDLMRLLARESHKQHGRIGKPPIP
jgi:hypothetical protein